MRLYHEGRLLATMEHGNRRCEKSLIVGVVRDTAGRPIAGAEVLALGSRDRVLVDDRGGFSMAVEPGPELLMIRAIGFEVQRVGVSVLPADTLSVTAMLARRTAQQLPEIIVEGRALPPRLAEFAKRMRASPAPRSRFIDPETMDTWGRFDLGNVLRRAGMRVTGNLARCPGGFRLSGNSDRGRGGVAVYLDGARVNHDAAFDVNLFPVTWFLAAEVYIGAAEIPIEYLTTGSGCVIILWTR